MPKSLADLEAEIGRNPFTSSYADENYIFDKCATSTRIALIQWLTMQGIPAKSASGALAKSITSAYTNRKYLISWRNRVNPGFALLGAVDDDFIDDTIAVRPEPTPYATTVAAPPAPTSNPQTEIWLKGLFTQVEKAVHALVDQRLSVAKIDLSDKIKQEIIALAKTAANAVASNLRNEAIALIKEHLPPRQIEIINGQGQVTANVGLQHSQFPLLLRAMQAKDHRGYSLNIWLTGPTGSGKTTAVQSAAKALGLEFEAESSLDADYKITGFYNANGTYMPTAFFRRYTEGGVILLDEIDNYSPSALLAVNSATANSFAQFPHGHFIRHKDCIIIACANTWGLGATGDYVGRTRLDAASLDRFQPKINWPYDETLERAVADAMGGTTGIEWFNIVRSARAKTIAQGLKIIISPRATYNGISLLQQGFDITDVVDMTLAAGISAEQKKAIGLHNIQPLTTQNQQAYDWAAS